MSLRGPLTDLFVDLGEYLIIQNLMDVFLQSPKFRMKSIEAVTINVECILKTLFNNNLTC
jgi:hypothetical protein